MLRDEDIESVMERKIAMGIARLLLAMGLFAWRSATANDLMEKQIDEIFAPLADANSPGLAVLVRKDGKTIFERGYGVRDLRTKTRIDAQTNLRLASFTKQFTAMSVMLLVHEKKLRYDETLTEIFPEFPAYGKQITVRHLLNHISGLPDYEDLMFAAETPRNSWIWTPERQIQDLEILRLLEKESKGKFPPGTNWSYSNSGYVVLGLIVAKVSGKPFREFLRERIFAPLKMDHTVVFQKGKNEVANRAFGHTKEGNGFRETDQSPTSATLGDGGIYSSLEDLAKWDEALRNYSLLSEAEMKPALTPAKLADGSEPHWPNEPGDDNLHPGQPVSYGFGWFLDPYAGHERTWHWGSTTGFRTAIERFTNDDLTVVILCNGTDLDPEKLALQVADLIFQRAKASSLNG
jgi:CubicO group peptidase (beta-lactamase class C family)